MPVKKLLFICTIALDVYDIPMLSGYSYRPLNSEKKAITTSKLVP
jgi:hypothetical protein